MGFLKKYFIEYEKLYEAIRLRNERSHINRIYYLINQVRNKMFTFFEQRCRFCYYFLSSIVIKII